jgi:hypothetical protein
MNSTVLIACFLVQSEEEPLVVQETERWLCGYGDEGG